MPFQANFLSPFLSTVPWGRLLQLVINYHFRMRMMVFYSPQVIFYQIPSPCSSLSRPHCHGDPITPKGSSELCGIWVKLHGVLADSKPYGCQVWKSIRMVINNNKKLLLSLQILGKRDSWFSCRGRKSTSCIQDEMIRFKLSWAQHCSAICEAHVLTLFWIAETLSEVSVPWYNYLNHFISGIWILNI